MFYKDVISKTTLKEWDFLYELCIEYEYKCEEYDRAVCSVLDERGFGVPTSRYEESRCNTNAGRLFRKLTNNFNVNTSENSWRKIRNEVQRLNFSQLEKEYKRIFEEN